MVGSATLMLTVFHCLAFLINFSDQNPVSSAFDILTKSGHITVQFLVNTDCSESNSRSIHFIFSTLFLDKCIENGVSAACVILHGSYTSPPNDSVIDMNNFDEHTFDVREHYSNLFHLHFKVLHKQRFSPAQLVLIPEEHCECNNALHHYCFPNFGRRAYPKLMHIPDVVLLSIPVNSNPYVQNLPFKIPIFLISSMVLIINMTSTALYPRPLMLCTTCDVNLVKTEPEWPLQRVAGNPVAIPLEIADYASLKEVWRKRHFNFNTPGPIPHLKGNDRYFLPKFKRVQTIQGYVVEQNILRFLNCTASECAQFMHSHAPIESQSIYPEPEKAPLYFPHTLEQIKNVYRIYTEPYQENWLAVLEPFTLKGWMLIAGTAIGLLISLKLLRIPQSSYVIFSILMAHGDVSWERGRGVRKRVTGLLIIWLFSSIVIREAYLSTMYSYLALQPMPFGLPKSLMEIAEGRNIPIVSTNDFLFEHLKGHRPTVSNAALTVKRLVDIYRLLNEEILIFGKNNQFFSVEFFEKLAHKLEEHLPVSLLKMKYDNDTGKSNSSYIQVNLRRFAFIYPDKLLIPEKSILDMAGIGKQRSFENDDMKIALSDDAYMWKVTEHRLFFESINGFMGKFIQSGIYEHDITWLDKLRTVVRYYTTLRKSSKSFKGVGNLFSYYFGTGKANSDNTRDTAEPGKVKMFVVIWVMLITMEVLASILFLWELR